MDEKLKNEPENAWEKHVTAQRLTARLAERLGCDPELNSEALLRLEATIYGLYQGAKDFIKTMKLELGS